MKKSSQHFQEHRYSSLPMSGYYFTQFNIEDIPLQIIKGVPMNLGRKLFGVTALTLLALSGCSSDVTKVAIDPSANPAQEITRVDNAVAQGYKNQLDVLDQEDFSKAENSLKEAKSENASGNKASTILSDLSTAEGYLKKAESIGAAHRAQISAVADAREKALTAGAQDFAPTKKELKKLDDDLRSQAGEFDKINAKEMSRLQASYLNLEFQSVVTRQLGDSKSRIDAAKDRKAGKYSPTALKKAEVDYSTAENNIRADRNLDSAFQGSVAQAKKSALMLTAVLAATKNGDVDEGTATQMVVKDQKIAALNGNLEKEKSQSELAQERLQGQQEKLQGQQEKLQGQVDSQNKQLAENSVAIDMQKSIDNARKQFSKDEADVFQQGDKLLIRLKKMNFVSGHSELPESSLAILAKVRDVTASLHPSSVVVEGHTDSVGNKQVNEKISQDRADAVAKYLEKNGLEASKVQAVGYGFEKPIASNKTKEGRSENRRVDVIVTPSTSHSVQ
jgi:OOP family OmpA-OmpF porin